jgi:hypothetical protein
VVAAYCTGQIPEFQVNSALCSHDFNGVQGSGAAPAQVMGLVGFPVSFNISGSPGAPHECLISLATAIPRSQQNPFLLTTTQSVNLDLSAPTAWWNGLLTGAPSIPNLLPLPPSGSINGSFVLPLAGFVGSIQCLTVEPTHPDGICLTQASELTVVTSVNRCLAANAPNQATNASAFKGQGVTLSNSATLTEMGVYLTNVPANTLVEWVVSQRAGATTTYNEIHRTTLSVAGGTGVFTTGPILVPLQSGQEYFLGAFWNQPVTYHYDNTTTPPQNFDYIFTNMTFVRRIGVGATFPMPTTFSSAGTTTVGPYWQCYTLMP